MFELSMCFLLLSSRLMLKCTTFHFASTNISPYASSRLRTSRLRSGSGLFSVLHRTDGDNKGDDTDDDDFTVSRNRLATELLETAYEIGQVGKWATMENRQRLDDLAEQLRLYSDPKPARFKLHGTHKLVYSGSDSGPTAGLVGPFVGKVTQVFYNETIYQNRVRWGPLQVSIFGERQIINDETTRVQFYQTQVHVAGQLLFQRDIDTTSRGGTWEHIFAGVIQFREENFLLRCMNTPKLFILIQPIDDGIKGE